MKQQATGVKVILLMCMGIFICMLDTTIMNITLPAIQEQMNVSLEKMSWMLNVYTIAIAVLSIPMARMAEIFGKGKFFVLGALLFGAGSALCGQATSGDFLIAARFLQSVGAAILMPVSNIIGVGAVPIEKRPMALGILGATQGLSAALGPTVGGLVTQAAGWPWVFYVNVPICLIAVVLAFRLLNLRHEPRVKVKIDWIGMVLSSIAIFTLTLGLVQGNSWGWTSASVWSCFAGSAVSLVLFIFAEMRIAAPMIDLRLFRVPSFSAATLVTLLSNIFLIGVTVLLPQFLTHIQGKTELQAALLVTPVSGTIFFLAPVSGLLARKFGNIAPMIIGFLTMGASYAMLREITPDTGAWWMAVACMLLGAGFGIIVGPISVAAAADFEGEQLTASQGVSQLFRQLGIVLAVAVFIAGLTHELALKKDEVKTYAVERAATLDVPDDVKQQVIAKAKEKVDSSNGVQSESAEEPAPVSKEQRDQLLRAETDKIIAAQNLPATDAVRAQVAAQVAPKIDESLAKIAGQTKSYRADMQARGKQGASDAFASLYTVALPVVCGSIVFAWFFRKKRAAKVPSLSHTS